MELLLLPLFRTGGIAPSYLWHRGRTASPREKPVSYEHKNKKQGTVRGSAQRSAAKTQHASQTNKFISNSSFCLCQYFLEPIVFQFKLHPWLIFTVIILNPQMTQSMIMWWKDQNRVDKLQWSGMQFYCAKSCCSLQWVSFFFKNIFQNSNSSVNHELDMILQVMSVLKCNQSGKTSQVVDLVTVISQQQCHGKYSLFFSIQMWPVTFMISAWSLWHWDKIQD